MLGGSNQRHSGTLVSARTPFQNALHESVTNEEPLAYFITWTVYGTHLQGDLRGWRRRRKGQQLPLPRLSQWHRERLTHPILLLDHAMRAVVEYEIERHGQHRGWRVWTQNARSNHVHVVVTARGYAGDAVRDQLKANCTRGLREQWPVCNDRPIWTVGGDWECINSEGDLSAVIEYVRQVQDRKHRDLE